MYHRSYSENQPFLFQYQPEFLLPFFSFSPQCNASPPDCRHQPNRSFLVHQPKDTSNSNPVPYAPSRHIQMNHHVGGIYLKLPQRFSPIFCAVGWQIRPNHTFRTTHGGVPVSNRPEHRVTLWKQLPTSNNRCRQISSVRQY